MSEQDRILQLVADGIIRPEEAAKLIAALNPPAASEPPAKSAEAKPKEEATKPDTTATNSKEKPATMEVQMQRPDGSYYTIQVPSGLIPAVLKIAGASIKESIKQNSREAWDGFKIMTKRKAHEVKENITDKVTGRNKAEPEPPASPTTPAPPSPPRPYVDRTVERQLILQMVQNGRINAEEASRLIEAMDAA
jgi:polyhydroxyalkanoate synthesis regulator phasin